MTPQEQRDLLLRVVIQFAEVRLKTGGLIPFGATLKPPRDVKILTPKSMKQNLTHEELNAYWARELRKAAAETGCKTVCSCAEVRYPANSGEMVPAVLVHIEHADSYSADVLCPFQKVDSSQVLFSKPHINQVGYQVFVTSAQNIKSPPPHDNYA